MHVSARLFTFILSSYIVPLDPLNFKISHAVSHQHSNQCSVLDKLPTKVLDMKINSVVNSKTLGVTNMVVQSACVN